MKKLFIFCSLMIFSILIMAQEIQLTFDSTNIDDEVDSIIVLNQRTGQSLKLSGNEPLILNNIPTVSGYINEISDKGFLYPNPTDGFSYLNYTSSEKGDIELSVYNSSGHLLGIHSNFLLPGNHQFKVAFPMNGFYIVSVKRNQVVTNFKAISLANYQQLFQIHYLGNISRVSETDMVNKSASVNKSIDYWTGDILLFTLYSGNMITVMTDSPVASRNILVNFYECKDPDDRKYKTLAIGSQVWMAENLAYLPSVSPSSQGSDTTTYYYVYDYQGTDVSAAKATDNYKTYGVLYNWPAAITACPAGWHLPSDAEWTQLENILITNGYNYDGTTIDNKIAKSMASTTLWKTHSNSGAIGNNLSLNNKSGFSAVPGGYRNGNGYFIYVGSFCLFRSSTKSDIYDHWLRGLYQHSSNIYRSSAGRYSGLSVRCVKD